MLNPTFSPLSLKSSINTTLRVLDKVGMFLVRTSMFLVKTSLVLSDSPISGHLLFLHRLLLGRLGRVSPGDGL